MMKQYAERQKLGIIVTDRIGCSPLHLDNYKIIDRIT
jgi:hypothetical protein